MAVAVTEGTRQMVDDGLFGYKNEGELHAAFDARRARRLGKMGRTMVIDRESAKAARATSVWCQCDDGGLEPRYVSDGVHTHCNKHHWDCTRCGGVVQVG
jgi:hypothetical protein